MKFTSKRYPRLKVHTPKGYVQFEDGEFETTDKAVIDVLENLPADREVAKVSRGGGGSKSSDE